MEKALEKVRNLLNAIFEKEVGVLVWVGSFLGIVGLRVFIETIVIPFSNTPDGVLVEYLHNLFFFLISFVVIWLILSKILHINPCKLAALFLGAAWLIVLPPILDIIKTGQGVYWSFYALDGPKGLWGEFITFFGHLPSGIVYFGTRIVFASVIGLIFLLAYVLTKNLWRSLFGAFMAYLTLFFMGSFPSWFAFGYYFFVDPQKIADIQGFHIAQLFGAQTSIFGVKFDNLKYAFAHNLDLVYFLVLVGALCWLFFALNKEKLWAVVKNARLPQLIYHTGLFGVGLGLGFLAYPGNLNLNVFSFFAVLDLIVGVWLAWVASVIVNDVYDFEIDKISNASRPLQMNIFTRKEYLNLGVIIFALSLLGGLMVSVKFMFILFFYQFLAWAYSAPPFRLKKFPGVATFISALASLLIMLMGFFLFSGDQNIAGLSWRIIILLLAALTLSLPIKDFKDIEGDKKYRIWTIPVIFGEEKGRLIVAVGIFISFMLSVFLLNEFRLFWWALLFGGAAFLIVINKKPRQLFWWVLGVVSIYGIILVKTLFL
ncbi:MAG: UbiA family prenyltransferase [Parcubacteria group bacterium]|jgi:chlorophyll synthase